MFLCIMHVSISSWITQVTGVFIAQSVGNEKNTGAGFYLGACLLPGECLPTLSVE